MPFWLETVWRHLGAQGQSHIVSVADGQQIIGIVPLCLDGKTARFLGSHEVCDYQDLIAAPGQGPAVARAALEHLAAQGVRQLDLQTLRPDSVALSALKALAPSSFFKMTLTQEDVTFETDLPDSWDGYLRQLNGKQRHEVRRKLRRLEDHGDYAYRTVENNGELERSADAFVRLFRRNREDKARFMSNAMERYFRELIISLAAHGMLRLYFLEVAAKAVATVLCFDYQGVRYLYNSGYDAQYMDLSVGVLSKVLSIRSGIEQGCRRYDFLKGDETYKKRIGGQAVPLYRCQIQL